MFTIYHSDFIGNPGNCSYPHKAEITDAADLCSAVSRDYVCAEYRNNYRSGDNFIGSDCLPVDCDNDHSENPDEWMQPADVEAAFPGVAFAVHYSDHICARKMESLLDLSSMCCFPLTMSPTRPATAT